MATLENLNLESNEFIYQFEKEDVKIEQLVEGDVLIHQEENTEEFSYRTNGYITESGIILQTSHLAGLHFWVFEGWIEGQPLVSDVVYAGDESQIVIRSIRMRNLKDVIHGWKRLKIK
jgi:hypothetical protein